MVLKRCRKNLKNFKLYSKLEIALKIVRGEILLKRCRKWLFSKVHNPKVFSLTNQGGRHFLRLRAAFKIIPSYASEASYIPQNTPRCMYKVLTYLKDVFWKMILP